jgi:hypothetical protein
MFLDQAHQVLQVAFGWSDSHLHRFALGSSVWDETSEKFLCPFDVDEGEDEGVPASEVRLDEVLSEADDELLYVYDYGDDWELRIRLEAVADRMPGDEPAVCTGGRRAAPPEDSGGIYAYDDLVGEPGVADPFKMDAVNAAFRSARRLSRRPALVVAVPRLVTGGRRLARDDGYLDDPSPRVAEVLPFAESSEQSPSSR